MDLNRSWSGARSSWVTCPVLVCLVLAGCDLTRVTVPDQLQLQNLQNPQGAETLRAGAIAEFAQQLSLQAMWSGLLVDELGAVPAAASTYPEDRRVVTELNHYNFMGLSAARLNALIALSAVKEYAPQPAWHVAELYSYVAATEIVFSENLCSGVPLGSIVNGTPTYGPTYTRAQLLAQASADLDSASAYVGGSDSISSLVAVLRGRTLLDNGQYADAATAVSAVPSSFVYPIVFSTTVPNQLNQIYEFIAQDNLFTVSDNEGVNGLPFVSAGDQRVPTTTINGANGNAVAPLNQNAPDAPTSLATGIEAQLILAEATLFAGQTTSWATILNNLRANAITPPMAAIPPDSTVGATSAVQLAVQFRERAFWLFGTGHRLGDLRRLVRQYQLPVESVFPTGLYQGGPQSYGTAVVYVPTGESPNANYSGCIDENP
jgi:starch-binding outer membrane protein, SusD/RagB family